MVSFLHSPHVNESVFMGVLMQGMTYDEVKKMFARGHTLFRAWSSKTGTGGHSLLFVPLCSLTVLGNGITRWIGYVERQTNESLALVTTLNTTIQTRKQYLSFRTPGAAPGLAPWSSKWRFFQAEVYLEEQRTTGGRTARTFAEIAGEVRPGCWLQH